MENLRVRAMPDGKNFVAWATDAGELLRGREQKPSREWIRSLYLVESVGLLAYVAGTPVVASWRGNGKSALVARQAVKLLDMGRKYVTLRPHQPFTNELQPKSIRLDAKKISGLTGVEKWSTLWACTLASHFACMVLRERRVIGQRTEEEAQRLLARELRLDKADAGNAQLDLPRFVWSIWIGSRGIGESIAPSISSLIGAGLSEETMQQWTRHLTAVNEMVSPDVLYAIHVDAVDEALGTATGQRLLDVFVTKPESDLPEVRGVTNGQHAGDRSDSPEKEPQAEDYVQELCRATWIAAQKGFLVSAHLIPKSFPFAKVFGSIRQEPVLGLDAADRDLMGINNHKGDGALVDSIEYSELELEQIFRLNVDSSDAGDLAIPSAENHSTRLFGFNRIKHSTVYGADEDFFRSLCRHTFGTARDLVAIAKAAKKSVQPAALRPKCVDKILVAIDRAAVKTFDDWKLCVVPIFDSALETHVRKLERNYFLAEEIGNVEARLGYPYLFAKLYARGMLGFPEKSLQDPRHYGQHFMMPDGNEHELPSSIHYVVLHPSLSAWICGRSGDPTLRERFYSRDFVVGKGLPCPREIAKKRLILDLTDAENYTLTADGRSVNLMSSDQFAIGHTAQERHLACEFLCALILAKKRSRKFKSVDKAVMVAEESHLKDVGLLREDWSGTAYGAYLNTYVFTRSKSVLFRILSQSLRAIEVTVLHSARQLSVSLMWRNGEKSPSGWLDISPDEIDVVVSQVRRVSAVT